MLAPFKLPSATTRLDGTQALQRAPCDLAALLRACVESLPPLPASDVTLTLALADDLGSIAVDARLLSRAVCNLLGNARRYADTRVLLRAARAGDVVTIVVEDDGPGIPAAEREQVFAPFYRLDRSRDRATGGFGLGLAIARKAVQLHGGSLVVAEGSLKGASMVITLPRAGTA